MLLERAVTAEFLPVLKLFGLENLFHFPVEFRLQRLPFRLALLRRKALVFGLFLLQRGFDFGLLLFGQLQQDAQPPGLQIGHACRWPVRRRRKRVGGGSTVGLGVQRSAQGQQPGDGQAG